jgi:hypothetical protein
LLPSANVIWLERLTVLHGPIPSNINIIPASQTIRI